MAEPGGRDMNGVDEALAALMRGEPDDAIVHLSAAIRALTAAGNKRAAAMASARLGDVFEGFLGNRVAARPWFARARNLLEDEEPCVEQGWVALAQMGCDVDDPAVLLSRAELALDRARRFGDIDLEVKALADGGLAVVQAGQVAEGMAMIDEAMALACGGGADDVTTVAKSVCSFYTACYYTADFERVESWTRAFRRRGVLGPSPGAPAIISSHCDSVRATLLCHLGRWSEAEEVLLQAHAAIEEAMPGMSWHPRIALADLRTLQGRFAEAETLLLGLDDHIQALLPTARLHLARNDHDLARATARRGLRMMADDRVRAATLLGVIIESELGRGDVESAARASSELDDRTRELGLPALTAEATRLRAKVRVARGELAGAIEDLQEALHLLAEVELPRQRMLLHLDLARTYEASGDRASAVVEARSAAALLAQLDVVMASADMEVLSRSGLDAAPRPVSVGCRVASLERAGDWWTARCGDTSVRLRDTKGLRYLAELVAHAGVERHALDLVDLVEGVPEPGSGIDRRRIGDAGGLLDAQGRAAYRHRVAELRDEVEEALALENDDRAAAAQELLDALVAELARSLGLGGRDRRAASAAERARLNVTRAIRAALTKLSEALPDAGPVLDRRVRTGLFCAYEPHPEDEAIWSVRSPVNGSAPD